jgi:hypothetical protein
MFFLGKASALTRPIHPDGHLPVRLTPERYIRIQPHTGFTTTADAIEMRGTGAIVQPA